MRGRLGGIFTYAQFLGDFKEAVLNGCDPFISFGGGDLVLDADEAGEAEGGDAEGTQDGQGLVEVLHILRALDDLADEDAQHGDLFLKVVCGDQREVGFIDVVVITGIEACLLGVFVAEGGAAVRFGWGGGGVESKGGPPSYGFAPIVELMF